MFRYIEYKDLQGDYVLVDVRSPKEFEEASIFGAVNIPLFSDEERKLIGYTYVNESVDKAKKLGIEAVSKRLPEIYDKIVELNTKYRSIVFYCAKGGMRSSSIWSLSSSLGMNVYKLKGGYKGYREFINTELPKVNEDVKYVVIHGKTGVGKTKLLKELEKLGYDILDLEAAANHRGSLLGSVGLLACSSQKQFETYVYEKLKNRKSNLVLVEGESKRIGNIIIPNYIYESMAKGKHIFVECGLELRSQLLIDEYMQTENCKNEFCEALDKLNKYICTKNIDKYKMYIMEGKYEEVASELMIKYYDPLYMNGLKNICFEDNIVFESIEDGTNKISKYIMERCI